MYEKHYYSSRILIDAVNLTFSLGPLVNIIMKTFVY